MLLVCVRLFDGNFARRGYCCYRDYACMFMFFCLFVFLGWGVMVVMCALVDGIVVFIVLGAMVVFGLAVLLRVIVLVLLE